MNKTHITSDQVKIVLQMYWHADNPSKIFSNVDIQDMRRSLEAAFPEPNIQELLRDEERSARHDYPHQPAAFGPLVVNEDDAEEINYAKDIREALQSFVNRHSIKPIAFADRMPEDGDDIWIFSIKHDAPFSSPCWFRYGTWTVGVNPVPHHTHWLPASALPIPEPAVDAKEQAWKEYCTIVYNPDEHDFKAGYEAGQANNCPKD